MFNAKKKLILLFIKGLMGITYSSGYNNSIVLTSEVFSDEFSTVSYVFMMIAYSILGIFYPALSYLTNDNWRILNIVPTIGCLLLAGFIFSVKAQRGKNNKPVEVNNKMININKIS